MINDINKIPDQKVSVVIPNFNGQNLLKKFLPSVLISMRNQDELIVVDDSSTDHSVDWIIRHFKLKLKKSSDDLFGLSRTESKFKISEEFLRKYNPNIFDLDFKVYQNNITVNKKVVSIKLISLHSNLRFGAAANLGFLFAKFNQVLLINNDVKTTSNLINQLLLNFEKNNVFGVGCLEFEKNNDGEKSGKNKLWFSEGIFRHSKADDFQSGETAWASGGSGLFDRYKWLQLNGFDKRFYPAYWEDTDISFRAKKMGWKVLFDSKAVVYHIHESTNTDVFGKNKIEKMSLDSLLKFTKKNANWWQKILFYIYLPLWKKRIRSL